MPGDRLPESGGQSLGWRAIEELRSFTLKNSKNRSKHVAHFEYCRFGPEGLPIGLVSQCGNRTARCGDI